MPAPDVTYRLRGATELQRALTKLDRRVGRKTLRAAARSGAVVVRKRAKANAPRGIGTLKRNVVFRARRGRRHETIYSVGWTTDAYWGMFQEFGTRHQAARPWLRPAFQSSAGDAEKAMTDKLLAAVYKGLKR